MSGSLRRACFLAVFGGVVCTLAAVAAGAQNLPAEQQAALPANSGSYFARPTHADLFAAFIEEIGLDDLAMRKEAITGQKQPRVDWKMLNHASIGLGDEEWAIAYAILLDGSQRMDNWGDAMQDALGWRDGRYRLDSSRAAAELASLDKLGGQAAPIVEDTMVRLRLNLGDKAFARLASFVYQRESGDRMPDRAPAAREPMESARVSAPPAEE
jgi:hypothetical protein